MLAYSDTAQSFTETVDVHRPQAEDAMKVIPWRIETLEWLAKAVLILMLGIAIYPGALETVITIASHTASSLMAGVRPGSS
jgi:hypothetical protein